MKPFCHWLERWDKIIELVKEHHSLKPFINWKRQREIEQQVGALLITALGKHGNSERFKG